MNSSSDVVVDIEWLSPFGFVGLGLLSLSMLLTQKAEVLGINHRYLFCGLCNYKDNG